MVQFKRLNFMHFLIKSKDTRCFRHYRIFDIVLHWYLTEMLAVVLMDELLDHLCVYHFLLLGSLTTKHSRKSEKFSPFFPHSRFVKVGRGQKIGERKGPGGGGDLMIIGF